MIHIDCEKYAKEILNSVKEMHLDKKLLILTAGEDPASESYVKGKIKDCEYCGVTYEHIKTESPLELERCILRGNYDDDVADILVQLPLPDGWNETYFTNLVVPEKDIDGLVVGSDCKPCTPEGIIYLLKKELGSLERKTALVIGRGALVGRPLANMLLDEGCLVTVACSRTKGLDDYIKEGEYDIIVSAVGKPNTLDLSICGDSFVVDVGVNRNESGKLCGDCYNFSEKHHKYLRVTPVPNGIELITRAMLLKHFADACILSV